MVVEGRVVVGRVYLGRESSIELVDGQAGGGVNGEMELG
jgi:hypothetical protein